MVGIDSTIIVPVTANEAKVRAISEYKNVKLINAGKTVHELSAYANEIVEKEGAVLVHPFRRSRRDLRAGNNWAGNKRRSA